MRRGSLLFVGLALVGCGILPPRTPERVGVAAQVGDAPSPWYGPSMAAAMRAERADCPTLPLGCFADAGSCEPTLCYCPRVCEPKQWLRGPGLSADGVWAGRGVPCQCE